MTDQDQNQSGVYTPDEIRADRACIGCGFNLYGQTVTKEEHYGMAITRCPECGTVAALQTYPAMSHWVNRFRALIAAVWVLVLLGAFIANTMAWVGMTQGASSLAGQHMSDIIGEANAVWEQERAAAKADAAKADAAQAALDTAVPATADQGQVATPITGFPSGTTIITANGVTTVNGDVVATPAPATTTSSPGQYRWTWLNPEWVEHHLDATVRDSGGLWKNINTEFLVMLIPGTIVATLSGIFWSVVLLGGTRKRAAMVPLSLGMLATLIHFGIHFPESGTTYASHVADDLYAMVVGPAYLGSLFVISLIGILIGRMVARFVVVMALPARNRVPLSLLWSCDGKALPRV